MKFCILHLFCVEVSLLGDTETDFKRGDRSPVAFLYGDLLALTGEAIGLSEPDRWMRITGSVSFFCVFITLTCFLKS